MPHDGPHDEEHKHPPHEHAGGKCGSGCSHGDKTDGSSDEHGSEKPHTHHHHHHPPAQNRLTVLAASQIDKDFAAWLERNSDNVMLASSVASVVLAKALDLDPSLAAVFIVGGGVVMNDACENLMAAAHRLEETQNIPRSLTAASSQVFHAVPEGISAIVGGLTGQSGVNVGSTYVSKVTHLGTMLMGAAAVGKMQALGRRDWTMHTVGIGGLSAAFGAPIIFENHTPEAIAVGCGVAMVAYLSPWYFGEQRKAGHHCIVHGPGCSGHHEHPEGEPHHPPHGDAIEGEILEPAEPSYRALFLEHAGAIGSRVANTPAFIISIPQRMGNLPDQLPAISQRSIALLRDRNMHTVVKSTATLGLASWGVLENIDTVAEAFALSNSARGTIHAAGLSASEAMLTIKAAIKRDAQMAWGAFGGCIAAMGIVGGGLLVSNAEVPELLHTWPYMTGYVLAPVAAITFTHPTAVEELAKVDNWAADRIENNFGERLRGVANWFRNDGKSISKIVAVPAFVASLYFLADAATHPDTCHAHLWQMHCGVDGPVIQADPNLPTIK